MRKIKRTVSVDVLRALANRLSAKVDDTEALAQDDSARMADWLIHRLHGQADGLRIAAAMLRSAADRA